jgi:hypothetical protein
MVADGCEIRGSTFKGRKPFANYTHDIRGFRPFEDAASNGRTVGDRLDAATKCPDQPRTVRDGLWTSTILPGSLKEGSNRFNGRKIRQKEQKIHRRQSSQRSYGW